MWHTSTAYIGEQLRKQGLLLEEEGDAAGFLGVTMEQNEGGSIELKQTGLIDRVLETLGLNSNSKLVRTWEVHPCRDQFID